MNRSPKSNARETLERAVVALVHQIGHHGRALFVQGLAREKLQLTHWMILEDLAQSNTNGLTMRQIAQGLGLKPSTVTGLVDALEERGWTLRHNDDHDRRVVRVALTKRGQKYVARIQDHLLMLYRVSMQSLDVQQLQLLHDMNQATLRQMLQYRQQTTQQSTRAAKGARP